jgi:cytochrome c biogenesis protein CcmG/thiol:disulfide interchange protein DsbE
MSSVNKSLLIPLFVFIILVITLGVGFSLKDPHILPSELIDRPFPDFVAAELHEPDRKVTREDLKGEVSLVNVWATWCPNCVIEHPELLRISKEEGIPLYGVNYNDDVQKAQAWLRRYENPFEFIIVDDDGKLGIDLGVYGAPETFIVDAAGVIQYKHVGPVSRYIFDTKMKPVIEQLKNEQLTSEQLKKIELVAQVTEAAS